MQDKQPVTVYMPIEKKSNNSLYSGKNVDEFISYLENKKGYFLTPDEWKEIQDRINPVEDVNKINLNGNAKTIGLEYDPKIGVIKKIIDKINLHEKSGTG
jgi:hypothetical protein